MEGVRLFCRLVIAAALGLALTAHADAQSTAQVLPSCGSASLPLGPGGRLYVDQTGNLCTAGSGGGSQTGSVTAPGTSGTQAQAVQGITGGVPVGVNGQYLSAKINNIGNQGAPTIIQQDSAGHLKVSEGGSNDPNIGITPAITQSGTAVVGKASQGNLYSAYAVNTTATAGYLACINATAAPAAGAAITPIDVQTLAGAVGATASVNYGAGPPNAYSTGIVCLVTTSLTTYTAGGASFIQARVR